MPSPPRGVEPQLAGEGLETEGEVAVRTEPVDVTRVDGVGDHGEDEPNLGGDLDVVDGIARERGGGHVLDAHEVGEIRTFDARQLARLDRSEDLVEQPAGRELGGIGAQARLTSSSRSVAL